MLRIFSPLKIRRLRPGLNPRTWVLKASTLNEEFNDLYCSSNVIRVIKSGKNEVSGAWDTCGGEERCIQGFDGKILRERDHLEDTGVDGPY